jgi:hypothetical protein
MSLFVSPRASTDIFHGYYTASVRLFYIQHHVEARDKLTETETKTQVDVENCLEVNGGLLRDRCPAGAQYSACRRSVSTRSADSMQVPSL